MIYKNKIIGRLFGTLMLTLITLSFLQCSSSLKLQAEPPTSFGEVYFQRWVSGVAQGPSGLDIYIEVKDNSVLLDSVYFGKRGTKLNATKNNKPIYVGSFVSKSTEMVEVTMVNDPQQPQPNKPSKEPVKNPFELAPDECVISYKINGKTKYYKLTNVTEKKTDGIPM